MAECLVIYLIYFDFQAIKAGHSLVADVAAPKIRRAKRLRVGHLSVKCLAKVERVYQPRYQTRTQAKLDLVNWIEGFYNCQLLRSSNGYRTPVAMEFSSKAA